MIKCVYLFSVIYVELLEIIRPTDLLFIDHCVEGSLQKYDKSLHYGKSLMVANKFILRFHLPFRC